MYPIVEVEKKTYELGLMYFTTFSRTAANEFCPHEMKFEQQNSRKSISTVILKTNREKYGEAACKRENISRSEDQ